jgi:hypothetical protein
MDWDVALAHSGFQLNRLKSEKEKSLMKLTDEAILNRFTPENYRS